MLVSSEAVLPKTLCFLECCGIYVQTGWPDQITDEKFKPFLSRKTEMSAWDGCILWGSRMVILPQGRELVLQELHETHPGCTRMKSLARNYIWWPKMDSGIEDTVKQCQACQESRPSPLPLPCIPGNGHLSHGVASIWVLQVHTWDQCSLYSLTLILNGSHALNYVSENN